MTDTNAAVTPKQPANPARNKSTHNRNDRSNRSNSRRPNKPQGDSIIIKEVRVLRPPVLTDDGQGEFRYHGSLKRRDGNPVTNDVEVELWVAGELEQVIPTDTGKFYGRIKVGTGKTDLEFSVSGMTEFKHETLDVPAKEKFGAEDYEVTNVTTFEPRLDKTAGKRGSGGLMFVPCIVTVAKRKDGSMPSNGVRIRIDVDGDPEAQTYQVVNGVANFRIFADPGNHVVHIYVDGSRQRKTLNVTVPATPKKVGVADLKIVDFDHLPVIWRFEGGDWKPVMKWTANVQAPGDADLPSGTKVESFLNLDFGQGEDCELDGKRVSAETVLKGAGENRLHLRFAGAKELFTFKITVPDKPKFVVKEVVVLRWQRNGPSVVYTVGAKDDAGKLIPHLQIEANESQASGGRKVPLTTDAKGEAAHRVAHALGLLLARHR